jgi:tetratricopeptide (TPR) repeat protein
MKALRRLAVAAVLAVLAGAHSPSAFSDGSPADTLREAARLLRADHPGDAEKLLEKLAAERPDDLDVQSLYQDAAMRGPDAAKVADAYRRRATERPDDVSAAYLAVRLLPAKEALQEFEKLSSKFATSALPVAGRGRALLALGRVPDAVKAFDQAVALAGDDMRFHAGRALALEAAGRWADARDEWTRVAETNPNDIAARLGLGEALRNLGDLDAAATQFDAVALAEPNDPEPPFRLGLVRMAGAKWDDALAAFEKSLALRPAMVETLCAAADAATRKAEDAAKTAKKPLVAAELDPAMKYADRAVAAAQDRPEPYMARGAVHEVAGESDAARWDAALADYQSAQDRLPTPGPATVRALLAKAHVLACKEDYDAAAAEALKATDVDPKSESAWAVAGEALMAEKKDDEAIKKVFRPGLRALPESARLHHAHGLALWRLEKTSDAAKAFKEAVRFAPENGRYKLSYGELLYQAAREKDATPELLAATGLRPQDRVSWSCYGHALVANQKWKEAADAFETVCALDDQAVDEHLALAVIYADRLKDKDRAKAHATTWRERGGKEPVLDGWVDALLAGK